MKKLHTKTTIITGATSGIGAACAKLFAQHGAKVVLAGRNEGVGKALQDEINALSGEALYIRCDVSEEQDIRDLVQKTVERFHGIDILVNNAGTFLPSVELDLLELDAWHETFTVNLDSVFLMIKYARPHLQKSKGVIVNTGSIAGMHSYAMGRSYAYSASKAALVQFTRMLAKNYAADDGIRVNAICPGIIETPMLHGRDLVLYAERIPLKRVGNPEDVAKSALFLASDDAAYLTGVVLPVDGGASL